MTIERKNESTSSKISAPSTHLTGQIAGTNEQRMLPTPDELVELLSKHVIGQTQAKQTLAAAVYQHFMNCAASDLYGGRIETENHVMLIGPSGSGKSLLLRTLRDVLKAPMFYITCTNITPDGYKGKNFSQHIDSISEVLIENNYTPPAIVVWNEVDKLSMNSLYSSDGQGTNDVAAGAGVYRRMTQTEFLTYLDGTKCGSNGDMDSSRILNVAMGAFAGIDEIRNPTVKPTVGFHHHTLINPKGGLEPIKPEDLIAYGLIPEFVGRFARIASLDPLDHSSLRRILTEAEGNVLARRIGFFALHGVQLLVTDEAIDELIVRALSQGTGARALRQVVDQVLRQVEYRLPDMANKGVHSLLIDRSVVKGHSQPIEQMGEQKNLSTLLVLRRHAAYTTKETAKRGNGDDLSSF